MHPRTPRWKRILVAIEVARLVLLKRFTKASPPVAQPPPDQNEIAQPKCEEET